MTVADLLAAAIARDPARPLLTWYDDATGERTELSGVTLDNWVAKTANLLVDGCGLDPGATALVDLPPHWQTAAVLLGCWSAGLTVDLDRGGHPDVVFTREASAQAIAGAEVFGLALAPLAARMHSAPPGVQDYVVEVRGHGDRFTPYAQISPDDPAAVSGAITVTHRELRQRAARRAAALGISTGDRVLIDAAAHPEPLDWLLAPLAAGASIVLCGQLDRTRLADRVAAEQVTVALAPS
jgi:uncharacterized protein (TIGR03089 family)